MTITEIESYRELAANLPDEAHAQIILKLCDELIRALKARPSASSFALLLPLWRDRLGAIFKRHKTTMWTVKEEKALDAICPIDEGELRMVERYYVAERNRPNSFCRTALLTLLYNWPGEVDRARAWTKRQGFTPRDAVTGPKPLTDEEFKSAGEVARQMFRHWRQHYQK